MSNVMKAHRAVSKAANKTNKVAKYLDGKFTKPSIYTEKGMERFIENQRSIGEVVNETELQLALKDAIEMSPESTVNDVYNELSAYTLSQSVKARMAKIKKEHLAFLLECQQSAIELHKALYPKAKRKTTKKAVNETAEVEAV